MDDLGESSIAMASALEGRHIMIPTINSIAAYRRQTHVM